MSIPLEHLTGVGPTRRKTGSAPHPLPPSTTELVPDTSFPVWPYDLDTDEGLKQRERDFDSLTLRQSLLFWNRHFAECPSCRDAKKPIYTFFSVTELKIKGPDPDRVYYVACRNCYRILLHDATIRKLVADPAKASIEIPKAEEYKRPYQRPGRLPRMVLRYAYRVITMDETIIKTIQFIALRIEFFIGTTVIGILTYLQQWGDNYSIADGQFWEHFSKLGSMVFVIFILTLAFTLCKYALERIYSYCDSRRRHKRQRFAALREQVAKLVPHTISKDNEYWSDEEDDCARSDPDVCHYNLSIPVPRSIRTGCCGNSRGGLC